jgi:hypothetical protein
MKKYTLHRFGLFSLLKFGFVTGLIASFPVIGFLIISGWRTAIELWEWVTTYEIVIPFRLLMMDEITLNAQQMLRGWEPLNYLEAIANLGWLQIILYIFVFTLLAGIWTALVGVASGLGFNLLAWLTGGLQISLSEDAVQVQSQQRIQKPIPAQLARAQPTVKGPRLEITDPIQRVVPITSPATLIGSGPDCAVCLDGLHPKHAQLSYEDGRYLLYDYSQGSTMVQGRVINGVNMVKDGFLIQLGHYKMVFRY